VIYDETCELCRRCHHWLATQPTFIELRFVACGDPQAKALYGDYPWYQIDLMVVSDDGQAWIGPDAFLMCLWATRRWRATSFRFRGKALRPMVERFFHSLSDNRATISGMLSPTHCDGDTCDVSFDPDPKRVTHNR